MTVVSLNLVSPKLTSHVSESQCFERRLARVEPGRQACWQVPSPLELSHWPKFLPSLTIVNDAACEHGCSNCQLKSLLPVLLNIYLKVELVGLFLGVYCLAYKQHQFSFLIITNSSFSFCHPHQQSLTSFYDNINPHRFEEWRTLRTFLLPG